MGPVTSNQILYGCVGGLGGGESRAMHKQEAGGFQEKFSSPCPLASQLNPTWIQNRVFTADSVLSESKTTDVFSRCCWFQLHVIPPRRCFYSLSRIRMSLAVPLAGLAAAIDPTSLFWFPLLISSVLHPL